MHCCSYILAVCIPWLHNIQAVYMQVAFYGIFHQELKSKCNFHFRNLRCKFSKLDKNQFSFDMNTLMHSHQLYEKHMNKIVSKVEKNDFILSLKDFHLIKNLISWESPWSLLYLQRSFMWFAKFLQSLW